MARPQPIMVLDPHPWSRSTVTGFALSKLVNSGQLAPNVEAQPATWIIPPVTDREPNPLYAYIVSFIRHHYGVELHNFAPNAILQAATFVGVYEGFLGIPVNWDLWVHLFRAELHTLTTHEPRVRHAVRAGGLLISLRDSRREFYIPCMISSNKA
jgi:hypothetical protein